jgi:GNAT superfamily N-acetyltransferase
MSGEGLPVEINSVSIRVAEDSDLPVLSQALQQQHFFSDRMRRQREGRGLLLVAWAGSTPVASVYLWLEPADEPELREGLPSVPLLTHLEVHELHRNRGIGTRLIQAAERILVDRGHRQVALGVGLKNAGALRLYRRLGYEEWEHSPIPTVNEYFLANGERIHEGDICRLLVKAFATDS